MPSPEIDGVTIEQEDPPSVTWRLWWHSNKRNRKRRAMRMLRNLRADGWKCWRCAEPIAEYKRTDARYCSEQCRKKAARARKAFRP